MVVHEVRTKDAHQVSLAEPDDVVQTFSANRAYDPPTIRIPPGRLRRADDFFDTHVPNALPEHVTIHTVAITNQESERCIVRNCLADLPCRPSGHRMSRDVEVGDTSAIMV